MPNEASAQSKLLAPTKDALASDNEGMQTAAINHELAVLSVGLSDNA